MSYLHVASTGLAGRLAEVGQPAPTPTLSPGDFGLAMSHVAMPADAIGLLLLSPTFKQMAQTLDAAYLDHRKMWTLRKNHPNMTYTKDFRLTGAAPGINGRRILYVGVSPVGSMFIPSSSVLATIEYDTIRFHDALGAADTIPWIEAIAHETAHAFARVTATGPGPATAVARAQAGVIDECTTRRREQKVIAEIRATQKGRKAFAGYTPRPIRTCDCERDWFPSSQKRTYLEHFVLSGDLESAAKGLSSSDVQKIIADVAAIPIKWSAKSQPPTMVVAILRGSATVASFAKQFPALQSPAGQAAFVLRIVDASWRQLIAKVGEGSPTWTGGAQQLRLERHARVFFKIKVSYTKCP